MFRPLFLAIFSCFTALVAAPLSAAETNENRPTPQAAENRVSTPLPSGSLVARESGSRRPGNAGTALVSWETLVTAPVPAAPGIEEAPPAKLTKLPEPPILNTPPDFGMTMSLRHQYDVEEAPLPNDEIKKN